MNRISLAIALTAILLGFLGGFTSAVISNSL